MLTILFMLLYHSTKPLSSHGHWRLCWHHLKHEYTIPSIEKQSLI